MNMTRFTLLLPCLLFAGCAAQSEQIEPVVRITVEWSGVSPEDIDSTLAPTITSRLPCLKNIQSITSISSEGRALIYAKGIKGTDPIKFTDQVRMVVDLVEGELPADAGSPIVELMENNAEIPEVNTKPVAEILISLNNEKASALGISPEQIYEAIGKTFKNRREAGRENIKAIDEIILTVDGKKVRLKDIAEVEFVQKPGSIVRKYPPETPK